jgi:hypothetical protein
MTEQLQVRMAGGFRGGEFPSFMSDGMCRRLLQQERAEQREEAERVRVTEALFGDPATRAATNAGVLAEQRGEYFTQREIMRGDAGRTKQEALAYASAQMDLEDAQQRARYRKLGWSDDYISQEGVLSADMSAPHPDHVKAQALKKYQAAKETETMKLAKIVVDGTEEYKRMKALAKARLRARGVWGV